MIPDQTKKRPGTIRAAPKTPWEGRYKRQDTPSCVACRGPGPFVTPTGHQACYECIVFYNETYFDDEPVSVTDVTDVTDAGGKL